MVNSLSIAAAAASILLIPTVNAAGGMYPNNSPVLQVDAKSYSSLIANSNQTSILEFYAPWCGHCQNLKPAYEKAAKSLSGLAKVAAINCDEETNKPFCGSMGVKGFPTLKIVKPGKKPGRPIVEDYQGARTAKAIVEAVKDKIPNHVKRISDKTLDDWLEEGNSTAKAILFTNKGTTSPLLKALAVDFLGSISVAQIRDKEVNAISAFGISSYPTFVLLPGGTADSIVYSGEMSKEAMSAFLSQITPPNPDPAPKAARSTKSKDSKKSKSASSAFSKASASHESADSSASKATQTGETIVDEGLPTESPNPNVVTDDTQKPVQLPEVAPTIPSLTTVEELQQACFTKQSKTCILALHTGDNVEPASAAEKAVLDLSEIHHRHTTGGHKLFPFYSVLGSAGEQVREALAIGTEQTLSLVAVNAKRSWIKKFPGINMDMTTIEDWVDAIRMGDGAKESLPEQLIVEAAPKAETKPIENAGPEIMVEEISDEEYEEMMQKASEGAKKAEEEKKKPNVDFDFQEITPEMKEKLLQQARDAAKKHDEL